MPNLDKVLIVDDDPVIQELLQDCLAPLDIEMETAGRGRQALEMIETGAYRAVILDLMLPEISGIEILKRLHGKLDQTEIIVLTGYASVRNAVAALRMGAYDYIVKPFHIDAIRSTVRRALEKQRLENHLAAIHSFSREMTLSVSIHQIGEAVLDIIERLLDVKDARVWLRNDAANGLYALAARGTPLPAGFKLALSDESSIAASAVSQSDTIYIPNLEEFPSYRAIDPATRSELVVPLTIKDVRIGALDITSPVEDAFAANDVMLLSTLASQVAVTLENAQLYQQAQQEIAERIEAEMSLAQKAEELERSNDELRQFAYIVSHDLQEPLRMISSYAQLLARRYGGQLDENADEFIGYIVNGAKRMQDMIKGLLAYSRVGTQGQAFRQTDSAVILQRTLSNLKLLIEESDFQITCDPLPTVLVDELQLNQIFQNLVSNAIRFQPSADEAPGHRPRLHISTTRDGDMWRFSVEDNGIGFDPEHAERIFEIFQRLHTEAEYPGTGIGLSICKKIVERHGGRIWAESAPGQGATFYFTLPAVSQ